MWSVFRGTEAMLVLLLVSCSLSAVLGLGGRGSHKEHHHYRPDYKNPKADLLKEDSLLRDREHLQEDIKEYYNLDLNEDMSPEELEFYYFQLHDTDHNGYLDGLEILTALNHILDDPDEQKDSTTTVSPDVVDDIYERTVRKSRQRRWNEKFEEDSKLVDTVLKENDRNGDGYISYLEYALSRKPEGGT